MLYVRNLCPNQDFKSFLLCFHQMFYSLYGARYESEIFFVFIFLVVAFSFLAYGYPAVPASLVAKTILSSPNCLYTCVENKLCICRSVSQTIMFQQSVCLYTILSCLDQCCFILSHKVTKSKSSNFILFQNCLGYSTLCIFIYAHFIISFSVSGWDYTESVIQFGEN